MWRALLLAVSLVLCAAPAHTPQRIVSLSPDLTEMLYGVGAFPRVVAVSNYDAYPPETAKLPRLGELYSPSFEKLTGMRPDLVVITNEQALFLADQFKQLGIPVLQTSNRSIQEVYTAIMTLGRATGNESQAAKLVDETRQRLDLVARKTSSLPKPRVVIIVDRTPGTLRDLYTATEGSYLAELVAIAGGRIALPAAENGYAKLRKEDLLAADPDIILDFVHGANSRFSGDPIEPWQDMPELKAFRTHRIYSVNQDFVPHASQRIVLTAELFAHLIHPEIE